MTRRRFPTNILILVFVIGLPALGLLGGGIFEIVVLKTGTPARARIIECHESGGKYATDICTGVWVTGGSLVGGTGRVVIGTVDGASGRDLGRTIEVRLNGNRAYTTSLRVPIVLLVLGLGSLTVAVLLIRTAIRQPEARPTPSPPSAAA